MNTQRSPPVKKATPPEWWREPSGGLGRRGPSRRPIGKGGAGRGGGSFTPAVSPAPPRQPLTLLGVAPPTCFGRQPTPPCLNPGHPSPYSASVRGALRPGLASGCFGAGPEDPRPTVHGTAEERNQNDQEPGASPRCLCVDTFVDLGDGSRGSKGLGLRRPVTSDGKGSSSATCGGIRPGSPRAGPPDVSRVCGAHTSALWVGGAGKALIRAGQSKLRLGLRPLSRFAWSLVCFGTLEVQEFMG